MKVAVCSLSSFTHVAEFMDAARQLQGEHEVRYFPGFRDPAVAQLLSDSKVPASYTFAAGDDAARLLPLHEAKDMDQAFKGYFFEHAALALPQLIKAWEDWRPDWVFSHLRDFAGMTAAEFLGVPFASFGSHQSPARAEATDPPFGAGQSARSDPRRIELAWRFHHRFNERMDGVFNTRIRRPLGLPDTDNVSTMHSRRSTLLTLPAFFSNKNSREPGYVHFVGPQFCQRAGAPDRAELGLFDRIRRSPRPRLLIAMGSTYGPQLMPLLLDALKRFRGSIVIAADPKFLPAGHRSADNLVCGGFFRDIHSLHRLVDAAVITGSGKSATDALRHGKPMLCVPRQGEQMENSFALESQGAAKICAVSSKKAGDIYEQVCELLDEASYRCAAERLGRRMIAERFNASEILHACNGEPLNVSALE